jgi:thiol-disulfide isomerase/thioredoxin
MKKILLLFLFFTWSLMAYTTGDILEKSVVEKLGLKKDTLYVVNFFASWCHSCKKELPLISKVYNEKVVEVVGVNVDKDASTGQAFVSRSSIPFKVVYDSDQTLISLFNPVGIPALYYVKNAKVLGLHIGAIKEIDKIIKEEVKGL